MSQAGDDFVELSANGSDSSPAHSADLAPTSSPPVCPSPPSQPSASAHQQRLLALRLKMNAGRRDNARSAKEEMERLAGKSNTARPANKHSTQRQQHTADPNGDSGERKEDSQSQRGERVDPAIVPLLHEPVDTAAGRWKERKAKQRRRKGYGSDDADEDEERREGEADPSGSARRRVHELSSHNVFDPQTAHRQYERNLLHARQQQRIHQHSTQQPAVELSAAHVPPPSAAVDPYTARAAPSATSVDRLVADMEAAAKRRAAFSRRRRFNDEEEVSYINESNRTFNKKVARAFDAFTIDIAQSLERGTAL